MEKRQYVISLSSINGATEELVGRVVVETEKVQKLSINTPIGFAITTHAFDDFLTGNDLLDYISPRINDIDYSNESSIKKSSEEIMYAIKNGVFPEIISSPILQAYSGLSGFYDAFVSLRKSPINTIVDEMAYSTPIVHTNITGKEKLLLKIKEAWAEVFTLEALKYRAGLDYEGFLTEGLVVQKMLQAEINGKVYSYNTYDNDKEFVEIQAFFGLSDEDLWLHSAPDSYIVRKKTQDIEEKRIIGQDYMSVRKGRANDKNPVMKIPISKLWHKKQKLDDKFILMVYRFCLILEENFARPIKASWELEAGRIFLTDLDIEHSINIDEEQGVVEQEFTDNVKPLTQISKQDGIAPKKSMDDYIKEVDVIKENFSTINSSTASDGTITVDIKPIEDLQIAAQGKGKGEKMVFGLAHLVFTDHDYENLTGDEILVIKTFNPEYYNTMNSVKGLILYEDVDSSNLLDINVPLVSSISDAFDIFQENEIVTLRPLSSCVYFGAGRETIKDSKTVVPIAEVLPTNNVPQQISPEKNDTGDIVFDAKTTNTKPLSTPAIDLPKTVTDFWQTYYASKPMISVGNVDGYVVRVADIIERYDKDLYLSELSSKIVEILNKAERRPVILVSAGRDEMLEEVVETELSAIAEMRNKDALRNLWYCFDNIDDIEDLIKLKKLFTSKGFRRSSTLKLLIAVHSPHSLIVLKGLLATGIDGVIVDLDMMFREHSITKKHNESYVLEFLADKIAEISKAKTTSMLLSFEYKLDKNTLRSLIEGGLNALAVDGVEIANLKIPVAEIESELKIDRKKKRGRKRKEIDFGF